LNTVPIVMPALRDRVEDILPLAEMFLGKYARRYKKSLAGFSDEAKRFLEQYEWPGNIRELDHAIERAVLLSKGEIVEPGSLGLSSNGDRKQSLDDMSLEEVEFYLIQKAMKRSGGNANLAAESLGLSRSAFYRRLQKYDL
jgi:DNA-binding NtrC family response regulator